MANTTLSGDVSTIFAVPGLLTERKLSAEPYLVGSSWVFVTPAMVSRPKIFRSD